MNLYKISIGKIAGSGFKIYLIKAFTYAEALDTFRINVDTPYTPDIKELEDRQCVEIINYDDPTYEG